MLDVIRISLACLLLGILLWAADEQGPSYPFYGFKAAREHEVKPRQRRIPLKGVQSGGNQLRLTLTVSPKGDVTDANATGDPERVTFWPQLEGKVRQWKFIPFEEDGEPITVEVEDYVELVPPERLPRIHVAAPTILPDSEVEITLKRSRCFGGCPSYTVTISTAGIVFEGGSYVVARGKHTDRVDADEVRKLAERFVAADFYSMDAVYHALVTDNPTYVLSIAIDGESKKVVDYLGPQVGMPAVITELEEEVDRFARTQRWIGGGDGLVPALQAESFSLQTLEAQVMLKEAASRGETETVREFLDAGVPLRPLPAPTPEEPHIPVPFQGVRWLNAASGHPEALSLLIDAGASENDQSDKDLALAGVAGSGHLDAVRELIDYGANPNADLSVPAAAETGGQTMRGQVPGSVLIRAVASGNPEMIREILRARPALEVPDGEGRTAVFALRESRRSDEGSARVECLRLLAEAGADLNARNNDGNTPIQ